MAFETQPDTLIGTKCMESSQCLLGEKGPRCPAIKLSIGAGLFVDFMSDAVPCSHLMIWGTGTICNCSTRMEIYEQNGV